MTSVTIPSHNGAVSGATFSAVLRHFPGLLDQQGLQRQPTQGDHLPLGLAVTPLARHLQISGEHCDEQGCSSPSAQAGGPRTCQQGRRRQFGSAGPIRPVAWLTRDFRRNDAVEGFRLEEVQGSRSSTQRRQEASGAMSVCGLVRGFVCALAEHSSRLRQRLRCRHLPRQYPSAGVLVHELDLDVGVNTFRNAAVELLIAVVDDLERGHRHLGGDGALARDLDSFAVDARVSVMGMLNERGLLGAPSLRTTEGPAWPFCRMRCPASACRAGGRPP